MAMTAEQLPDDPDALKAMVLGAATDLHHLVKHLRLPAQGVLFELLDDGGEIARRD